MDTREILNSLISKSIIPFTAFKLKAEFMRVHPNPDETKWPFIRDFLEVNYTKLLSILDLTILEEVYISIRRGIVENQDLSFSSTAFEQEDPEAVAKFLGDLHTKSQELSQKKEELIHYISLFNSAINYFSSFKDSTVPFLKILMPQVKDVDYFLEDPCYGALVQDLDSNVKVLKSRVREFNSWVEDIINPRNAHLFKIESSVRLLQKYRNVEGGRKLQVERTG